MSTRRARASVAVIATLILNLLVARAAVAGAQRIPPAPDLAYWAIPGKAGIDVREEPEAPSAIVVVLRAPTVLQVIDVTTGWMLVRTIDDKIEGWIEPDSKYMFQRSPQSTLAVVATMNAVTPPWPLDVQLEILQMKVRVGFTAPMVTLALGDPIARTEGDAEKTERWRYADRSLLLVNGIVTQILPG